MARSAGLTYDSYERLGYDSFALINPVFRRDNVVFKANRMRVLTPGTWLWRANQGSADEPYIQVENWNLQINPDAAAEKAVEPSSTVIKTNTGSASWTALIDDLKKWLPSATLTNGVVDFDDRSILVPYANWHDGELLAKAKSEDLNISANIETAFQQMPYKAQVRVFPFDATVNLLLQTNLAGNSISGSALWESNRLEFSAQLPVSSMVPDHAELTGTNLVVPSARLGLRHYEDLRGSLAAVWKAGAFDLRINGAAKPREEGLPPLTLELVAEGNTNAALLRVARLDGPGIRAELSRDVGLLFKPPWLADPAQLFVSAEFDQLRILPLCGNAQANVFMSPHESKLPSLTFLLQGTDVGYREYLSPRISAEGILAWPDLQIHELAAEVAPGSTAVVSGSGNISNKVIHTATATVTSSGPPAALAKKVHWNNLDLTAAFSGPVEAPQHSGRLNAVGVSFGKIPDLGIALDWKGRHTSLEQFELLAKAQTNSIQVIGSMFLEKQTLRAALSQLTISSNGIPVLGLETQPGVRPSSGAANAQLQPTTGQHSTPAPPSTSAAAEDGGTPAEIVLTRRPGGFNLRATPFALTGSAVELRLMGTLNWPVSGDIQTSASQLNTALIQEFVPVQSATVKAFSMAAKWSNSPVTFAMTSAIDVSYRDTPFSVEARVSGNPTGTTIEQAAVVASNAPVLIVSGRLPWTLVPGATNVLAVDPDGPVKLTASAQPHSALWDLIGRTTRWRIEKPELLANVSGTWSAPDGRAQFRAARVLPPSSGAPAPEIGPLNVTLHAQPGMLTMDPLELEIQGQRLTATAELPLSKIPYKDLRETLDLARASARIQVKDASISAFTPFVKSLTSEGQVGLDLSLRPGFALNGSISVSGARTVPLGTLGPVRDITLKVDVENNIASLEFARAQIGGVPVTLQGEARLVATNLAATPFRIAVKGSKVPLSRQAQAIIRADINAEIIRTNSVQPIITGEVRLRDSYYLSDLAALIPGKVANPKNRPPYFSIEEKIIANWRLDVQATGIRGLRFRTPVVSGEVSPNLRLSGTLQNPIAIGDVSVNSGSVRFPFGSLNIQQGLITATTQDPAHPSISLQAAARQYGYDIRMDVSGKINSPVLQFSSTPPLSSDQILMMLTAGELPRGTGTLSAQQRAQSFAVFIGRDVLAKLGFGDQGGDRLIIRSGEEFSEEGRPTYDVEYKLDKRWSLTGEYDRFGDFNAGFKWRIYSK
jgi:translocation and assembly module TamB